MEKYNNSKLSGLENRTPRWFQENLRLIGFKRHRNFYLPISESEEINGVCYSISVFHQTFYVFFNSDETFSLINCPYQLRRQFFVCANVESVPQAVMILINWGFSDFNLLRW